MTGNNGWERMDAFPQAAEKEEGRPVLVWHVYQGVMVCNTAGNALKNRFHAYWREPPRTWEDPKRRKPTEKDADAMKCVLTIDEHGTMRIRTIHYVLTARDVMVWAPMPEPPGNYQELKREAM